MTVHLGIDLGTTFSTVAAARNGHVELLSLGTRGAAVPSVVFVREDGTPLVGEAAEARAQGNPSRFAREFKRRLGDPTPLILGGVPMGAERLSGYLLGYLVDRATERLGEAPSSIVVTHPASYTEYRLDLLGEAVRLAGLADVRLLAEPRAAAIHYAADNRVQEGETVAVYDFGGGTFDTALVRLRGGEFELIGEPQGIDRFGGIDIDLAVFDYVCDEAADLVGALDSDEPTTRAMLARLRSDCRLAKERLSADTETVVAVATPRGTRDIAISRRVLESMIRFRLADTVQALDRAVRTAGLDKSDVARVLLVGGSSRIPLVRTLLSESFGRPVSVDADPESAIALGAAAAAARWATRGASPDAAATIVAAGSARLPPPVIAPAGPTDAALPAGASTPPAAAEPPVLPAAAPAITAPPPPAAAAMAAPAVPRPNPPAAPLPPTPGTTKPTPPPPNGRRKWIVVAASALVAVLVVAVVVVLATRSSKSDGTSADDTEAATATVSTSQSTETTATETSGTETNPTDTRGTETTTGSADSGVEVGDDVGLNPPDGLAFEPMPLGDVEAVRDVVAGSTGDSLDRVTGSLLVDDRRSTKGALVLFQNDDDQLDESDAQAIIDAVVGEESVTEHADSTVNGVTGQKFLRDDGTAGWIGLVEGAVAMITFGSDEAAQLESHLQSLAANNLDSTNSSPSTSIAPFDIANVTIADVSSTDPGINPPAGFHFAPLTDTQVGIVHDSAASIGPAAPSLHTAIGLPLSPDDGTPQIGGLMVYLGDGTAEFQQQVIATVLTTGTDAQPLDVGQFAGSAYIRGDGTHGWIGTYHDTAIAIGIDSLAPDTSTLVADLQAFLTSLDAANPA